MTMMWKRGRYLNLLFYPLGASGGGGGSTLIHA